MNRTIQKITPGPLTLRDCSREELISIIERMTRGLGSSAQAFLELELARADLLRMREAVRKVKRCSN